MIKELLGIVCSNKKTSAGDSSVAKTVLIKNSFPKKIKPITNKTRFAHKINKLGFIGNNTEIPITPPVINPSGNKKN